MTIRDATPADAARVVVLLGHQLDEHTLRPPDAVLADAVAWLLSRRDLGRILLATADGAPVGVAVLSFTVTVEHGGRSAWLDELYVEPAHRGRGVGTALLQAAQATAAAEGARALDLEVEAGHDAAARLYARHGFRRHDRQRWFLPLVAAAAAAPPSDVLGEPLTGGCVCGAAQYRITAPPLDVTHCHCTTCRRGSGAPFVTWATVAEAAFAWTGEPPAERTSTPGVRRTFCARCGTPLTIQGTPWPGTVDVAAGTLDAPDRVAPRDHTFVASKLPWIRLDDGLPRFAAVNPHAPTG